ncbi:hypothetical protein D3C80_1675180 [compost metagenome]
MAAVIAAVVFVGEQGGDFLDQRVFVGHGDQPFGLRQLGADILEVEGMRPHQHRNCVCGGFQRIMPAAFYQAAADKGQIGNAVQQHQFAHGIANHHLGAAGGDFTAAAQGVAETGFLHQFFGGRETFRMTRHQNQQQVGVLFQ